jgi:hypothetical protein
LIPLNEIYLADADHTKAPMVAWTHSDHGSLRTAYVFAYSRQKADCATGFTPSEFGFNGKICVLNARSGILKSQSADKRFTFNLNAGQTAYYLVTPVGSSGIAFFGDAGKFVSNGRQRIAALDDDENRLNVTVTFAAGEKSVRLFGYARRAPAISAQSGSAGVLNYDAQSGMFSVDVSPATTIIPGKDPTQTAVVEFTGK